MFQNHNYNITFVFAYILPFQFYNVNSNYCLSEMIIYISIIINSNNIAYVGK